MIVLFYNFIESIDTKYNKTKITQLLKNRIEDKDKEVQNIMEELDEENKQLVKLILKGKMNNELKLMVNQIIENNKDLLEYLSPELWAKNIKNKVFVIHGANDSMVPFTESILLSKQLSNSTLLISFLYEHREISTNRGVLFKIKEIFKMIKFFANYFRYNL